MPENTYTIDLYLDKYEYDKISKLLSMYYTITEDNQIDDNVIFIEDNIYYIIMINNVGDEMLKDKNKSEMLYNQ